MANYQQVRVKPTNAQLKKLKSAARKKTGTILRLNKENFQDGKLPNELFLITRQTTEIRNAFANSMSTDIKLSKAQVSKIIQPGGSFGSWLGHLGKKALTDIDIPLARENLPGLFSFKCNRYISKKNKCKRSCQRRKIIYFICFEWRFEWYC